jgi:hypothetical protein
MSNLVKNEFGINKNEEQSFLKDLNISLKERDILKKEFDVLSKLEVTKENIPLFKELRLKIVKNRTKGIEEWHKVNKAYYLNVGRFLDSYKNKEVFVNKQMEEKLLEAEKHFENLEKERLALIEKQRQALQSKRVDLIYEYLEDANERDLTKFVDEEWDEFFELKKNQYYKRLAAEKEAAEKAEQERKKEAERVAEIEAENERLRKQKEEADRVRKIEEEKRKRAEEERIAKDKAERDKLEAEAKAARDQALKAQRELEAKAKQEKEAAEKAEKERLALIEAEAKKGDAEKIKSLQYDLAALKNKYQFKSNRNQLKLTKVNDGIDKIILFLND